MTNEEELDDLQAEVDSVEDRQDKLEERVANLESRVGPVKLSGTARRPDRQARTEEEKRARRDRREETRAARRARRPEPEPTRPPTRPPGRPEVRPPARPPVTDPGLMRYPVAPTPKPILPFISSGPLEMSVTVTGKDGKETKSRLFTRQGQPRPLENGRCYTDRVRVGETGLFVVAFWDEFRGLNAARVTIAFVNGFASNGAALFRSAKVLTLGDRDGDKHHLFTLGPVEEDLHAVRVAGVMHSRACIGPDAEQLWKWSHVELHDYGLPWIDAKCEKGFVDEVNDSVQVGPYLIADGVRVKGSSSLNGSHGGWKVAPWHMGPEGWQRGSAFGYRWAEVAMRANIDRSPLAFFDPVTLMPKVVGSPYWNGRSGIFLKGFEPDRGRGECSYLGELEQYVAPAHSHLHRMHAPAAMLAPHDSFAQWLLVEIYWNDLKQHFGSDYIVDPKPWEEGLLNLDQRIEMTEAHVGDDYAGRGFGHSLNGFLYAAPYMGSDEFGDWKEEFKMLVRHFIRPNGIMHNKGTDPSFGVPNSARAREVDLCYQALLGLGLLDEAKRCRKTMSPIGSVSVAEAFDSSFQHWSRGPHVTPDYYHYYDLIRGDSQYLARLAEPWQNPAEQLIGLVPPGDLHEHVVAAREELGLE